MAPSDAEHSAAFPFREWQPAGNGAGPRQPARTTPVGDRRSAGRPRRPPATSGGTDRAKPRGPARRREGDPTRNSGWRCPAGAGPWTRCSSSPSRSPRRGSAWSSSRRPRTTTRGPTGPDNTHAASHPHRRPDDRPEPVVRRPRRHRRPGGADHRAAAVVAAAAASPRACTTAPRASTEADDDARRATDDAAPAPPTTVAPVVAAVTPPSAHDHRDVDRPTTAPTRRPTPPGRPRPARPTPPPSPRPPATTEPTTTARRRPARRPR